MGRGRGVSGAANSALSACAAADGGPQCTANLMPEERVVILQSLCRRMRTAAALTPADKKWMGMTYRQCVDAQEIVTWIVGERLCENEMQAVELGKLLQKGKFIVHVWGSHTKLAPFANTKMFFRYTNQAEALGPLGGSPDGDAAALAFDLHRVITDHTTQEALDCAEPPLPLPAPFSEEADEVEAGPQKALTSDIQLSKVFFGKYSVGGYMSPDQFRRMCAEKGYTDELGSLQLDEAFVRLDKDADGYLKFSEFQEWWSQKAHEMRMSALAYQSDAECRFAEAARSSFTGGQPDVACLTPEMFRLRCYHQGFCLDDRELQEAFMSLDKDGNGVVDFVEFLRWWHDDVRFEHLKRDVAACDQVPYVQQVAEFFQQYDADLTGSLSYEQFEPLHRSLVGNGSLSAPMEEICREVDTDNNGKISLNEFIRWYTTGSRW